MSGPKLDEILIDPARSLVATRELLLLQAFYLKKKGDHLKSVLYQAISLCHGFDYKYINTEDDLRLENIKIHEPPAPDSDSLYQQIIRNQIHQLPDQWTVVQLCKAPHHLNPTGRSKQILQANAAIYLSLLAYPRSELNNHEPLLIEIEKCEPNILERFVKFDDLLTAKLTVDSDTAEEATRINYRQKIQELDAEIQGMMTVLLGWMAPYSYLMTGKLKGADGVALTANIYRLVDTLCERLQLTTRQQILLSMYGVALVSNRHSLKEVYETCAKIATSQQELDEMVEFMVTLDNSQPTDDQIYPCILVVDERLDMVPWEMINKFQDTCRVSSLQVLYELFDAHRTDLVDGYLQVAGEAGGVLLNPDGTLESMEKRMLKYFNYYYPGWRTVVGGKPTADEYKQLLCESDIYIYSGHGSGLQFLGGLQLAKLKIRAVSFLIGCSSTKLASNGSNSEMHGSHLHFHGAKCPTVVGSLWLITDFYADNMLTAILSNWLGANGAPYNWLHSDKKKWRAGELVFSGPAATEETWSPDPNLVKVLRMMRNLDTIPLRIQATFVIRGLPVMLRS